MIKNISKNTLISKDEKLNNGINKTKGLMFINKPKTIYFKTRFGIHTFFVKFPIDVIILDKNSRVVNIKINLRPNNIFFWNPIFNFVLELPAGTINATKTTIGDKLELKL